VDYRALVVLHRVMQDRRCATAVAQVRADAGRQPYRGGGPICKATRAFKALGWTWNAQGTVTNDIGQVMEMQSIPAEQWKHDVREGLRRAQ